MKKRIPALLISLAMCVGIMPTGTFAQAEDYSPKYLALGDSISTGYGLEGYTAAAQSPNGFTYLLADQLGFELTNMAVDGNTAVGILAQLQTAAVQTAVENADVITITAGGNDLMGALYQAIADDYNSQKGTDFTGEDVMKEFADGSNTDMSFGIIELGRVSQIVTNFAESDSFNIALQAYKDAMFGNANTSGIIDTISVINPDAVVVLATQYNPYKVFNTSSSMYSFLYKGVEAGIVKLNAAIAENAETEGYIVADVYSPFAGSTDNLCNAANGNLDFHPNAAGHAVIAEVFADVMPEISAPITVEINYNNTIFSSVTGSGTYKIGDTVTLTAEPITDGLGGVFCYWLDNSVTLPEFPSEDELKQAIVSYEPTYTFTATESVSLTAVGDYKINQPEVIVESYLFEDDSYTLNDNGWGHTSDYDFTLEIGKQEITVTMDSFPEYITVNGQSYMRGSMLVYKADEGAGGGSVFEEIEGTSLTVPVAPVYGSIEFRNWRDRYSNVIIAYHPYTETVDTVSSFLGGSLRIDTSTAEKASLRFGYVMDSALPEGAEIVSWSWKYGFAEDQLDYTAEGEKYTETENGMISNLVLTDIPAAYYKQNYCAQLTVVYELDGEEYTSVDEVKSRNIYDVATAVANDSAESESARAYAQSLIETADAV